MNEHIDEVSEGINAALDTVKSLVNVLVIAYNVEITKLLKESIEKSQEIIRLNDSLERAFMVPFEEEAKKALKRSKKQLREVK